LPGFHVDQLCVYGLQLPAQAINPLHQLDQVESSIRANRLARFSRDR
jgi:hypothetical protein